MSLPKVIVILGPTASGKTALALHLAKKIAGEVVSADSRQIYQGMDIGTAKPTKAELRQIKHHLIDTKNPEQAYTLGEFKNDASRAIQKIINQGKLPFLVGGSGLYVYAIVNNLEIPKVKPNRQLRKKLERMVEKHGLAYAYGKLTALDPEAAYIVDPHNPRRVIRALEIAISTGQPFSQTRKIGPPLFNFLLLGVALPREKLKQQISKRVEQMIKHGLVNEVKNLVNRYGPRRVPFDAIGYREIIDHLNGKIPLAEAIKRIKKTTWQFAKRQMTWFRKMPVVWIKSPKQAEKLITHFTSATNYSPSPPS